MTEKITVNAQSSIRVDAEKVIYFDPFMVTEVTNDADIIFITHVHHDHFSPEDIAKVAKADTVFVAPESMKKEVLEAGIAPEKLITLTPNIKTEVCGIPVETVPSYNVGKKFHPKENGWIGYIVTVLGTRVYVGGDMDPTPEAKAVDCDVAMIPIGGHFTMDYAEAAAFINELKPKTVIPTHYGTGVGKPEDGKAFKSLIESGIEVVFKL